MNFVSNSRRRNRGEHLKNGVRVGCVVQIWTMMRKRRSVWKN